MFSAGFSLFCGNSRHDSAINGLKPQRTGGSSATGTAGGQRTNATPGHEDFCAAQIDQLSGSVHLLFSSFVSFLPLHQLGMYTCQQVQQRETVCCHLSSALPGDLLTGNDHRVTWQNADLTLIKARGGGERPVTSHSIMWSRVVILFHDLFSFNLLSFSTKCVQNKIKYNLLKYPLQVFIPCSLQYTTRCSQILHNGPSNKQDGFFAFD